MLGPLQGMESILLERYRRVQTQSNLDTYLKEIASELSINPCLSPDEQLKALSVQELGAYLGIETGVTVGFPLGYFNNNLKALLGYYIVSGARLPTIQKTRLTEEQDFLVNSVRKGIFVINASAGTGKTTTANRRAASLVNEGVLVVSYTRSAIDENYFRLKTLPGLSRKLCKRTFKKDRNVINVTTVDSFAYHLTKAISSQTEQKKTEEYIPNYLREEGDAGYDASISRVNANMAQIARAAATMKEGHGLNTKICCYSHIIVDEAQDIDDPRGTLLLLYAYYFGVRSITIFGDPRQQIHSNAGYWYADLWKCADLEIKFMNGQPLSMSLYNNFSLDPSATPIQKPTPSTLPLSFFNSLGSITKIGFTYTHRFQNRLLTELANTLSRRRPELHHPLVTAPTTSLELNSKIEVLIAQNGFDADIGGLADYLVSLHCEYEIPYKEMAIVGPSLEKNNMTSDLAGKINTILTDRGIPCYNKIEGSFVPNGVLFTTIHGIKGKEFDYVFLYGADSYPETFKMIPYEEAESLIYVSHTRARKRMFYLSPKLPTMTPPRGLRKSDLEALGYTLSNSEHPFISKSEVLTEDIRTPEDTKPSYYRVTDLITDHNFNRFLQTNGFTLAIEEIGILETELPDRGIFKEKSKEIQDESKEIKEESTSTSSFLDPRFWGILNGFAVACYLKNSFPENMQSLLANSYQTVSDREYRDLQRRGVLANGFDLDTSSLIIRVSAVNELRQDEYQRLSRLIHVPPREIETADMIFLASIYDFLVSGNMITRYTMLPSEIPDLCFAWERISDQLTELFGKLVESERSVELGLPNSLQIPSLAKKYERSFRINSILGSIDLVFENYIVELKSMPYDFEFKDGLQVMMYSLASGKAPVLFNLQMGTLSTVTSNESLYSWRHLLKSYCQLRTHIESVVDRQNRSRDEPNIVNRQALAHFVTDTEFIAKGKETIIFDITLVNMQAPYRSLTSLIRLERSDYLDVACKHLHVVSEALKTAKTQARFIELFRKLCTELNITEPVIGYYIADNDVSWLPDDLREKVKCVNLGVAARKDALDKGYISSGQPPPLSDYYDLRCRPTVLQPHLELHTSLPDTLMLYELLAMGIIEMG